LIDLVPLSKNLEVVWSCPHKKQHVEIDRRIEMMMQGLKDSTISLTDNFSGLSYLVCTSVTDS